MRLEGARIWGGITMKWKVILAALPLALACGRGEPAGTSRPQAGAGGTGPSSNDGGGGSPNTDNGAGGAPGTAGGGGGSPSTGGGSNAAVPCNGTLILRIAVNDLGSLQSLDLGLAGITLQGTSGALAADFTRTGQISLPAMNDRLAVLKMPTGDVDVAVQLDTAHACSGARCTDLDLCTSPLAFHLDVSKVSMQRCQDVLLLDVANSLQSGPGGSLHFLPRYSVHY